MKWVFLIFTGVIGLAFVAGGVLWGINRYPLYKHGVHAKGVIVEQYRDVWVHTRHSTTVESLSYYPVVEFRTEQGGIVRFKGDTGTTTPTYVIGTPVPVLYDSRDPSKARIGDFENLWLGPFAVTIPGIILLIVSPVVFFSIKKDFENAAFDRMARDALIRDLSSLRVQGVVREIKRTTGPAGPEFILVCRARTREGDIELYESAPLAFDPGNEMLDRAVDIFVDPSSRKRYAVDVQPLLEEILKRQR